MYFKYKLQRYLVKYWRVQQVSVNVNHKIFFMNEVSKSGQGVVQDLDGDNFL